MEKDVTTLNPDMKKKTFFSTVVKTYVVTFGAIRNEYVPALTAREKNSFGRMCLLILLPLLCLRPRPTVCWIAAIDAGDVMANPLVDLREKGDKPGIMRARRCFSFSVSWDVIFFFFW